MLHSPQYTEYVNITHDEGQTGIFPTEIETDQLRFTPLLDFEAVTQDKVLEHYQHCDADTYFPDGFGLPETQETFDETIDSISELQTDESDIFYALEYNGEFAGQATIEDVDLEKQKCAIGILLWDDYRGNGISQERAEALIHAIFSVMDITLVEVVVATDNTPSNRAVKKYINAFDGTIDGTRRQELKTVGAGIQDTNYYSISKSEFYDG